MVAAPCCCAWPLRQCVVTAPFRCAWPPPPRTSSLHQVPLVIVVGRFGTWNDPRCNRTVVRVPHGLVRRCGGGQCSLRALARGRSDGNRRAAIAARRHVRRHPEPSTDRRGPHQASCPRRRHCAGGEVSERLRPPSVRAHGDQVPLAWRPGASRMATRCLSHGNQVPCRLPCREIGTGLSRTQFPVTGTRAAAGPRGRRLRRTRRRGR